MWQFSIRWSVLGAVFSGVLGAPGALAAAAPDFNRDVRPILSRHCFKCHGPDEATREAGVRLDRRDGALAVAVSGETPIVPGQLGESELIRRIESLDPDVVMPPPSTHLTLTAAEKDVLRQWIAAGAPYAAHWAFVAPRTVRITPEQQGEWCRNTIDEFLLTAMHQRGLSPSPEADRATLARRVSLDLVGLPPTVAQLDAFLADEQPDAYERYVDRLLASPQYGERWAREWLDLARYADTNGYEKDRPRTIWPYRDWVIRVLNADLPFDRFTIEQLAGDLLPDATVDQRIATGFHRNTMLNEEGGIDPLEFRFHALTDRVATTGTVWLGLTVGCAQCHTHKYDPLTHTDYYRLLAFLNNADEPDLELPDAARVARQQAISAEIAERERDLPQRFPPLDAWTWTVPHVLTATSAQGATMTIEADESIVVSGLNPETDTYTLQVETPNMEVSAIQIEALTDASLGQTGPGRTPHGNFVITELQVDHRLEDGGVESLQFQSAAADFSQHRFPAEQAIDGKSNTGWAIQGDGQWNVPRTLTAKFSRRIRPTGSSVWTIRIEQWFGSQHTLGKFRVRFGAITDTRPLRVRQSEHFAQKYRAWLESVTTQAVRWETAAPVRWTSTLPKLERLDDQSLLASGDFTKRDVYALEFGPELNNATAIRLEAIPDERLPRRGPGAVYYEGPRGDFFLSEIVWSADGGSPWPWADAAHSFANGRHTAAAAIDHDPLTGWAIDGKQGERHTAVFRFAEPLPVAQVHQLQLIFERYYAAGMGRFRVSFTRDPVAAAVALPPELETLLTTAPDQRTPEMQAELQRQFCKVAPELATERQTLEQLRKQIPDAVTTLVMQERPADNPRQTQRHHRGEFLQAQEIVSPGVPDFLHPLSNGSEPERLRYARWLVAPENPLVGRVTVNRHWAAFFGRGLVRTTEDFGYQGALPTHPELLDWLATEFVRSGWSVKRLQRLIVTSAAYRQSARVTPELLAADPQNLWLARAPRQRLDAEVIRDSLLQIGGLLSDKQLGPSVYPPQPESITTEGAYGKLTWTVSPGEDRYRRSLYTFAKRTTPFAMLSTFDAPSGEACLPRRDNSNTPLQALTLLNDPMFVETAQRLGLQYAAEEGTVAERMTRLMRQILGRRPAPAEAQALTAFYEAQLARFSRDPSSLPDLTGQAAATGELGAWMVTARAILNLDEVITRE